MPGKRLARQIDRIFIDRSGDDRIDRAGKRRARRRHHRIIGALPATTIGLADGEFLRVQCRGFHHRVRIDRFACTVCRQRRLDHRRRTIQCETHPAPKPGMFDRLGQQFRPDSGGIAHGQRQYGQCCGWIHREPQNRIFLMPVKMI
ncbi:hypothetical protein SDC9_182240 [bioreactor metagenome]|uniref:Uncharacterized protein n=1 Tax=bioreactor metagenome TaxID=1076179 RepID=A0A645H8B7_9ZZZZ